MYHGDCLKLAQAIPNEHLNLTLFSPPYSNNGIHYGGTVPTHSPENFPEFMLKLFLQLYRASKQTASVIMNINDYILDDCSRSTYVFETVCKIQNNSDWFLYDVYHWVKSQALPYQGSRLNSRTEYIFHFVKDTKNFKSYIDRMRVPYKASSLNRFQTISYGQNEIDSEGVSSLAPRASKPHELGCKPTNVMNFRTGSALRNGIHPTVFHPDLPNFYIRWLSAEGDVVLDPFAGSGTTLITARKMNRKYIGFELNKTYFEEAQDMLEAVDSV